MLGCILIIFARAFSNSGLELTHFKPSLKLFMLSALIWVPILGAALIGLWPASNTSGAFGALVVLAA